MTAVAQPGSLGADPAQRGPVQSVPVQRVPAQRGPIRRKAGSARAASRTQAERRAESERRLLRAAAELFVERGIAGASLAEIGRRAGYSHGMVHRRFGSKEALVERLSAAALRFFTEATTAAVGEERGRAAVLLVADTYLDLVEGADPLGRVHLVIWNEAISRASESRAQRAAWDRFFRLGYGQLIREAAIDASIDLDPEAMAMAIVGMLRGVALQVMLDPSVQAPPRAELLDQISRMLEV